MRRGGLLGPAALGPRANGGDDASSNANGDMSGGAGGGASSSGAGAKVRRETSEQLSIDSGSDRRSAGVGFGVLAGASEGASRGGASSRQRTGSNTDTSPVSNAPGGGQTGREEARVEVDNDDEDGLKASWTGDGAGTESVGRQAKSGAGRDAQRGAGAGATGAATGAVTRNDSILTGVSPPLGPQVPVGDPPSPHEDGDPVPPHEESAHPQDGQSGT